MYKIAPDILVFLENNFLEIEPMLDRIERLIEFLGENHVEESKDRIIRCILFLSAANENLFLQYIELAKLDFRDIIYLAEYEDDKQIRNFTNSFG
jgi:hypothetical protein